MKKTLLSIRKYYIHITKNYKYFCEENGYFVCFHKKVRKRTLDKAGEEAYNGPRKALLGQ